MNFVLPFFGDEGFDPETTHAMGEAFDMACKDLDGSTQSGLVKEIIAKRIIEVARRGERDPQRLFENALQALGIDRWSA